MILDIILLLFFAIATYFFYHMLPLFITKVFFPYQINILELVKLVVTTYLLWYLFHLLFLKKESNFFTAAMLLFHIVILLFFLILSSKIVNSFLLFMIFFLATTILALVFRNKLKAYVKPNKKIENWSILIFPFFYLIFLIILLVTP